MKKTAVVSVAPYPVSISSGRHLTPGEIAELELDYQVQRHIEERRLAVLPVSKTDPLDVSKTTIKTRAATDAQEATSQEN